MAAPFELLANFLRSALNNPAPNETIQLCGLAAIGLVSSQPYAALTLAREQLQASSRSAIQWRRLFEDASLFLVVNELVDASEEIKNGEGDFEDHNQIDMLSRCVKYLDGAILVAGAPGRRPLIDQLFQQFGPIIKPLIGATVLDTFSVPTPPLLMTEYPLPRVDPLGLMEFQRHLDQKGTPIIIPQTFEHWPARERWGDLRYLTDQALHGFRNVPVEVGSSYADADWRPEFMTFNDFVKNFLLPKEPTKIGYLAMHDIFTQIPTLRNDIAIPDFCYSEPKVPTGAAAETPGLSDTCRMETPALNVWLGPKGTKTPLHTDPYHNIFCQVVGWKYVRLYPPEERVNLYPHDNESDGHQMSNTSRVDIFKYRPGREVLMIEDVEQHQKDKKFPRFKSAKYREAILRPGDALYVPLGWWHYIEALTTSISVSFWWN